LTTEDRDDDVVWIGTSEVPPGSPSVVTVQRAVPLQNVPDGDYTLKVELGGVRRESRLTVDHAARLQSVRVLARESLAAGDGRIRFQRGLLLARVGNTEGAITELIAAGRLLPRNLEIHMKLALLLYATERYAEVVESLRSIAPHYPNESDALVLLGFASLELGDAAKAVSYLESALALRPDDERLMLALARAREESPAVDTLPQ
jgi:tetratricopeptide (TPR) repeat protein